MPLNLPLALRSLLGDYRYGMLRDRKLCQQGLREYSAQLSSTPSPRNMLLCLPAHNNIGDHAIAYAEHRLLASASALPTLDFADNMSVPLRAVQRYASPDDVFYLHGGGNMGTLYQREEQARCDYLSMLPHNTFILFPQTISYDDTAASQQYLRHTQTVYGKMGGKLHLFARETVSFDRMKRYYPKNDVRLTPDIVLSLTDQATADPASRQGILLCMRNDVEKTTSGEAQTMLEQAARATGEAVAYTDTTTKEPLPISVKHGEELVLAKFDEFRKARLVITDRLHGMIFSAVTGTPCIAMNNSTGKVGFEYQWLKDFPYIAFAQNAKEAVDLVPQMMQAACDPADATALLKGLAPKFKPLTDLIR